MAQRCREAEAGVREEALQDQWTGEKEQADSPDVEKFAEKVEEMFPDNPELAAEIRSLMDDGPASNTTASWLEPDSPARDQIFDAYQAIAQEMEAADTQTLAYRVTHAAVGNTAERLAELYKPGTRYDLMRDGETQDPQTFNEIIKSHVLHADRRYGDTTGAAAQHLIKGDWEAFNNDMNFLHNQTTAIDRNIQDGATGWRILERTNDHPLEEAKNERFQSLYNDLANHVFANAGDGKGLREINRLMLSGEDPTVTEAAREFVSRQLSGDQQLLAYGMGWQGAQATGRLAELDQTYRNERDAEDAAVQAGQPVEMNAWYKRYLGQEEARKTHRDQFADQMGIETH